MRKYLSKALRFVNMAVMPLVLISGIAILSKFLSSPDVHVGCGCNSSLTKESNIQNWMLVVTGSVLFQFLLLFCFVYPLYLHLKKMLATGFNDKFIITIVKRASVASAVCILTSFFDFAFGAFYYDQTLYVDYAVHTLTLVVNLIAVILSFANWRDKVFPFGKKLKTYWQTSYSDAQVHFSSHTT